MLTIVAAVVIHVPTYDGGSFNCFIPPHKHTTSQAIYLRGSGGLEIPITSDIVPFDMVNNELIDFDAVFRDRIDPTTYDLYVGCGGCHPGDAIETDRVHVVYQKKEVEPFSQTAIHSVWPKKDRKFNASLLSGCHGFTIRLVDHFNRTDGQPIFWAAVVGMGEEFTILELLSFPIYVLRNHGGNWNELEWSYLLSLFFFSPFVILATRKVLRIAGYDPLDSGVTSGKTVSPREGLYELSLLGFVASAIEMTIHLFYAQSSAPVGAGFGIGVALIFLGHSFTITIVIVAWSTMYHPSWVSAHPAWAPIEVLTGFSFLLLFGVGLYVGPIALLLAGIVRLGELAFSTPKDGDETTKEITPVTTGIPHRTPALLF
jgi:hypothetical protein